MASINFLNHIDLNRNEIQNPQLIKAQVDNQINDAAVGGTPVEGQLYFNTTSDILKVYAGGAWVEVGAENGVTSVDTSNSTYLNLTPASPTNGAVVVTAALSAVDGTSVTGTRFLSKDNTWDVPSYTTDTGVTSVIDSEGTGSTGTPLVASISGRVLTIDSRKYVGGSNVGYVPQGGGATTFLRGDGTWVVPTDTQGVSTVTAETTNNKLGIYVNPNAGAVKVGLNITGLAALSTGATGDYIPVYDTSSSTNKKITISSIVALAPQGVVTSIGTSTYTTITGTAAIPIVNVSATTAKTANKIVARDASGYGYVATPASGDSSDKIATTSFVQQAVTGLLEFKGGFNASTGAIVGGGNLTSGGSRVAVAVGDYYVVTVAGNFFGNAATPLTPGDSVMVQTDAATGTSNEADFIMVQSDTDLATISTLGIGNVNSANGDISVVYSNGTAVLTNNVTGNIVQDLWKTVSSSSGSTTANSPTDTLSVVGAGGITTSISGDTLTITSANTNLVTSVNKTTAGTSTGNAITVSPTAGSVLIKPMAYAGAANVGHVPTGGSASTYLRGDGSWVTPPQGDVTGVIPSTVANKLGISITSQSGPVPVVGLDVIGRTNLTTPATADSLLIYDTSAATNKRVTVANLIAASQAATSKDGKIAIGSLSGTVTHTFGINTIVQTFDATSGDTVFCDITRTATTAVATITATSLTDITILVQKVG